MTIVVFLRSFLPITGSLGPIMRFRERHKEGHVVLVT